MITVAGMADNGDVYSPFTQFMIVLIQPRYVCMKRF